MTSQENLPYQHVGVGALGKQPLIVPLSSEHDLAGPAGELLKEFRYLSATRRMGQPSDLARIPVDLADQLGGASHWRLVVVLGHNPFMDREAGRYTDLIEQLAAALQRDNIELVIIEDGGISPVYTQICEKSGGKCEHPSTPEELTETIDQALSG